MKLLNIIFITSLLIVDSSAHASSVKKISEEVTEALNRAAQLKNDFIGLNNERFIEGCYDNLKVCKKACNKNGLIMELKEALDTCYGYLIGFRVNTKKQARSKVDRYITKHYGSSLDNKKREEISSNMILNALCVIRNRQLKQQASTINIKRKVRFDKKIKKINPQNVYLVTVSAPLKSIDIKQKKESKECQIT